MPFEARLFIKTGMVYLALTFLAGAVLAWLEAAGRPAPFVFAEEHGHIGLVGWLVNVVAGVALWMFPLDRESYPETSGRYPIAAALTCYSLLNVGLPLRVVSEIWLQAGGGGATAATLLALSAAMQLVAILVFAGIVWRRIRVPKNPAPGVR